MDTAIVLLASITKRVMELPSTSQRFQVIGHLGTDQFVIYLTAEFRTMCVGCITTESFGVGKMYMKYRTTTPRMAAYRLNISEVRRRSSLGRAIPLSFLCSARTYGRTIRVGESL
jgi:hypothetical protein